MLEDSYGLYAENRLNWLMGTVTHFPLPHVVGAFILIFFWCCAYPTIAGPAPNALPAGEASVTGDVTDARCCEVLAAGVRARFSGTGATLYTSDIGADAASDYNRQEEITSFLNFGQVR